MQVSSLRVLIVFQFSLLALASAYGQSADSLSAHTAHVGADSLSRSLSPFTDTTTYSPDQKRRAVQAAERLFERLLGYSSDKMGLNGESQILVSNHLLGAAASILAAQLAAPLSDFQLYPFQYLRSVSLDPNQNYLLVKGPILSFTQTHTLLPNYKLQASLDSSLTNYSFTDEFGNRKHPLKNPTRVRRDEYLVFSTKNQIRNLFTKTVLAQLSAKEDLTSGAIRLFSATVTTNETFKKIFGGDEVAVEASGNINLSMSVAREKSSNSNVQTGKTSSVTPKFEQKQQFSLRGTIGKKVEILIDQDSEREFDFENNIRLTYTGFDDEVLQKLEAGNIDLSLPGTEFVTTGGQNKGLFGVKALFRLGNLDVTTIASIQRGEKQKVSWSGGKGQTQTITLKAYDYAKAKYFFVSSFYRDQYETYVQRIHQYDADKQISSINVYKGANNNNQLGGAIPGRAFSRDDLVQDTTYFHVGDDQLATLDPNSESSHFIELKENVDFTIDRQLGILLLNTPIQESEILGVRYTTRDAVTTGLISPTFDRLHLKILWNSQPGPTHPAWNLEMKNYYDLGVYGVNEEDLKSLKIIYRPPAAGSGNNLVTSIKDEDGGLRGTMEILHIDEVSQSGGTGPDQIVDAGVVDQERGIIRFPRLRPFDPNPADLGGGFDPERYPTVVDGDSVRLYKIYDFQRNGAVHAENLQDNRFQIQMSTTQKSSTISLGINILEGSEEVLLDGEKLEKDLGYHIDYFSGTIQLLDPRAKLPSTNVEIRYEQAQLFQVDKKAIFGARAEYDLEGLGLGPNSFIGTTALFQSQSTINKRVQLGEEPFRNFVWDVNTSVELGSGFLTKLTNYIPLVSTSQPSKITFRGEYAVLLPTPNTSNGLMKADENGVAYVDDFEAVKRTFPLGTFRRGWSLASVPIDQDSSLRGKTIWYQWQEPRKNISKVDALASDLITTLGIAFQPERDASGSVLQNSWGGIMRGLPTSARNELSETRFIEFWINNLNNSKGVLHIELGAITEDQNGVAFNREVKRTVQLGLEESEDLGLDELRDAQEDSVLTAHGIPRGTLLLTPEQERTLDSLQVRYPWGTINYARTDTSEDPFGDNFDDNLTGIDNQKDLLERISTGNILNIKINGTQGNIGDGRREGDTEDLNGNSVLDVTNSFLRFSVPLDTSQVDKSLLAGVGNEGWVLYRIPVLRPDSNFNGASLQASFYSVRFWFAPGSLQDSMISVRLSEPQLVTSEWNFPRENPTGVIVDTTVPGVDTTNLHKIVEISNINTEESPDYTLPPGVRREYISGQSGSQRRRAREQSLMLRLNELRAGATALIVKNLISSDLRNYGRLKMYIHGDPAIKGQLRLPTADEQTDYSPVRVFLRFGSNRYNYYEIEQPLFVEWTTERNSVDIDFRELTSNKFDTTVPLDSATNSRTYNIGAGKVLRIRGSPSLANITQIYLGAINVDETYNYSGDIWFNELRVTDANDESGYAAKAFLSFNMADFASFSTSVDYRTSEFRTIDQRFDANSGDNRGFNFGGSLSLQKFYVERWGLSLPLSFNYSHRVTDPKYLPNNDILVSTAKQQNRLNLITLRDRFGVIVDSLVYVRQNTPEDTTYLRFLVTDSTRTDSLIGAAENFTKTVQTVTTSRGFGLNFSKTKSEQNFWLWRYTIDNLSSNFSYSVSDQRSAQYARNRATTWSSSSSYTLGFKRRRWQPFAWMPFGNAPIVGSLFRNINETDLHYTLITSVSTDFSITSARSEVIERDASGNPFHRPTVSSLTSSRGYGMALSPFQALTSNIGVKYNADLRGLSATEILKGVFSGLNPFDGFDDFKFQTPVDTVRRRGIGDSLFYVFNRDYSVVNTFTLAYAPQTLTFVTHTINYSSTHSSSRQRPPTTIFFQSSLLTRRVQADVGFKFREFVGSILGSTGGKSTVGRTKPPTGGRTRRKGDQQTDEGKKTETSEPDTAKAGGLQKARDVLKGAGSFAQKMINSINDMRFNITFENNIQMGGLSDVPGGAYKWFGYTTTPQGGFFNHLFTFDLDTVQQFSRTGLDTNRLFQYIPAKSITYGFVYGLNFQVVTIDLRFDRSERRARSVDGSETRTISRSALFPWLVSSPVPIFYDVTVRFSNLARWPVLSVVFSLANNVGASLSFAEKQILSIKEPINDEDIGIRRFRSGGRDFKVESITRNRTFPQINIDVMWKGNVSHNFTFTQTRDITEAISSTQTNHTTNVSSTLSFTKRGGFKLPLWFLKKKRLDNEIRVAATFSLTKRLGYNRNKLGTGGFQPKEKINDDSSWSIQPRMDYSFTSRLTGGIFLKYGQTKSFTTGRTSTFLGGLTINISIGT